MVIGIAALSRSGRRCCTAPLARSSSKSQAGEKPMPIPASTAALITSLPVSPPERRESAKVRAFSEHVAQALAAGGG
jgi:hypothetical protein